jgi:putative acetyltransferase
VLRDAQRVELAARYNSDSSEPGSAPTEADFSVFIIAYINERPVACGALRELTVDIATGKRPPGDAEIKRMFVSHESRGRGKVASAILKALKQRARARGWKRLVLETGNRQPDAIRFYTREGYLRIPNFRPYAESEHSLCFGREI